MCILEILNEYCFDIYIPNTFVNYHLRRTFFRYSDHIMTLRARISSGVLFSPPLRESNTISRYTSSHILKLIIHGDLHGPCFINLL